ncbi:hypothetical protein GGS26DRAFT_595208 [Hypomontagnella submonticulosa]|nr:hypothetical protein GGS26DRAFT_595208 [Hypomontagnella submonticulosa]
MSEHGQTGISTPKRIVPETKVLALLVAMLAQFERNLVLARVQGLGAPGAKESCMFRAHPQFALAAFLMVPLRRY